jgi:hypothetical protein
MKRRVNAGWFDLLLGIESFSADQSSAVTPHNGGFRDGVTGDDEMGWIFPP